MACISPNCSYISNNSVKPPALQANPDISGIGVLVGFIGTAYITFLILILRYTMGNTKNISLDDHASLNPVDQKLLSFIWRKVGNPPERWEPALTSMILAFSDTQIVTGLSILAGGYSQIHCGLSIFHWQIAVFLAWFSSATHLTTLTFLRKYIHNTRGLRTLRLFLMLSLFCVLAIALVPTGGVCGTRNGDFEVYDTGLVYPGAPVKCCFNNFHEGHLIEFDSESFISMILSEIVLISSTVARVIKLFRSSSNFAKEWLRNKPARICKRIVAKLGKLCTESNIKIIRNFYLILHCAGIIFIIFARAFYDLIESNLWEISWLMFSLAWGTTRMFQVRALTNNDYAATGDSQEQVVLQESFWGFGQWVPTLLLMIPLLSIFEGYLDSSNNSSNMASDAAESENNPPTISRTSSSIAANNLGSNRSLLAEQSLVGPLCNIDLHRKLDRRNNITLNRRIGTELISMEQQIGTDAETSSGTIIRHQSILTKVEPQLFEVPSAIQSSQRPWPEQTFYNYDFYTCMWYNEMLICMYLIAIELGIQMIISCAGVGLGIVEFLDYEFLFRYPYISMLILFLYATICIIVERQPDRMNGFLRSFLKPRFRYMTVIEPRRLILLGILLINISFAYASYVGIGISLGLPLLILTYRYCQI